MADNLLKAQLLPALISRRNGMVKAAVSSGRNAGERTNVSDEDVFHRILTLERRRAERSRKPFVLMLLDANQENGAAEKLLYETVGVVASSIRETDSIGWYRKGAVLGLIFTELGAAEAIVVITSLHMKVAAALNEHFGDSKARRIFISLHMFPENWDPEHSGWVTDSKLYPEVKRHAPRKRISLSLKRAIDIVGSSGILVLMSPVLLIIALIIRLTSKGPVLFRQVRLGQRGARFNCLKFRTMYMNCDSKIHQDYIQRFISGSEEDLNEDPSRPTVYKIAQDPRVTPIGKFLRKTSLDEFPQFWNVLWGEMSLVGPRPPVPYEFELYDVWHRRRVFELKPGVTGLWQVSGRSRTRFDDMVRLDLRYHQSWSLWLDLKILLATPRAVFSGQGAY
jgi:lipopolysaccharide/colanic/teichoic acid biosynthesis glycosyltransferase